MRIISIGGGNMAGALLGGAVNSGIVQRQQVVAVDPSLDARSKLQAEIGILTAETLTEISELPSGTGALLVLLAVKPQVFPDVAGVVTQWLDRIGIPATVVSIMAGLTVERIREQLGGATTHSIARVMPNTPASVGEGVSALASDSGLEPAEREAVCEFLAAAGHIVEIPEELMDAFTGVAGSGPAYVFAFVEALTIAGVDAGLPEAVASESARQTLIGAAALLKASEQSPESLRIAVTSPKGTTEAGLNAFEGQGLTRAVRAAVIAARDRGRELGM